MSSINFRVPTDRTMLGLLTTRGNEKGLQEGFSYDDDHLIRDPLGHVVGRWLGYVSGVRLWEPKLEKVRDLEALRWRVVQAIRTRLIPAYQHAHVACAAIGNGWASFKTRNGAWRAWRVSNSSISIDADAPGEPENVALGTAFRRADWRLSIYRKFQTATDVVLREAIGRALPRQAQTPRAAKVELNGRVYWMLWRLAGEGYWMWGRLAWPEDDLLAVTL